MLQVEIRLKSKPHQLRQSGLVPLALIQRTHETLSLQAPLTALKEAVRTADEHGRIEMKIPGSKTTIKAVVKTIDQDPLKHQILSVVLQEISDEDTLRVDIPVVPISHLSSDAEGQGATLTSVTDHIKVRGKVADIPDHLEVDISSLEVGGNIRVGDVKLPDGVELLSSPDAVLFTLKIPRAQAEVVETEAAAAVAEPAPAE